MPKRTLLIHEFVTGGGLAGRDVPASWAAEGAAMRRALAGDFARLDDLGIVMTLDDRLLDEPGPWAIVRVGPGQERATLGRLAAQTDAVLLVAPETGGCLVDRARLLRDHRALSLGATPEAIALAGDKLTMARHLARAGIDTPESVLVNPAEDLPRAFPYPAVLKPLDGAGSLDTFLLDGPDRLPPGAGACGPALLQPYVAGVPHSASFLVDVDGRAHLVGVGRMRVVVRAGRFHYLGGTVPAGFPALAGPAREAIAAVPGLRGWVGVDFLHDEDQDRIVILEINPRLTTSYVGLRRCLPPGTLARAWLQALDDPRALAGLDLSGRVHAGPPLPFAANGAAFSTEDFLR